jgi:hypothetical protein
MDDEVIKLRVLGRTPFLGEAYDIRRDLLTSSIIFTDEAIRNHETSEPAISSNVEYKQCKSISEKASFLDVSAHLKLSVLGGLVNVKGSGSFLKDSTNMTSRSTVSVLFKKVTNRRLLRFNENEIYNNILKPAVMHDITGGMATHIVTEITYGGNFILTFMEDESSEENKQNIGGSLDVEVKWLVGQITGGASVNIKDRDYFKNHSINFMISGDIDLSHTPTTIEGAIKLAHEAGSRIGDGVPIEMGLQPVKRFSGSAAVKFYQLHDKSMRTVEEQFQGLYELQGGWNKLDTSMKPHEQLAPSLLEECEKNKHELDEFLADFTSKFKDVLLRYRKEGKDEILVELDKLCGEAIERRKSETPKYRELNRRCSGLQTVFLRALKTNFTFLSVDELQGLILGSESLVVMATPPNFSILDITGALGTMKSLKEWREKEEADMPDATTKFCSLYLDQKLQEDIRYLSLPNSVFEAQKVQLLLWHRISNSWSTINVDGWACLRMPDGDYIGEMKDGRRCGRGSMTYLSREKHVGSWRNNKEYGNGTRTDATGKETTGCWRDGVLNPNFCEVPLHVHDSSGMLISSGFVVLAPSDHIITLVTDAKSVFNWLYSDNYIVSNMQNIHDPRCLKVETRDTSSAVGDSAMRAKFGAELRSWGLTSSTLSGFALFATKK